MKFPGTMRDHTGPYRTIWDHKETDGTIHEQTEPHGTIRDHKAQYGTIWDHAGDHKGP